VSDLPRICFASGNYAGTCPEAWAAIAAANAAAGALHAWQGRARGGGRAGAATSTSSAATSVGSFFRVQSTVV